MSRAWLLSLLLATPPAWAQPSNAPGALEAATEPTRIVLLNGPELDELAGRFAAELATLRFEVIRQTDDGGAPTNRDLEVLALNERARAAVRVAAAEGAIDLWLVNPATHEAIYRRIAGERDPAVAVLRSLEILRGSLVDLQALQQSAPKPPSAPPPALTPAPQPDPRLWLGFGVQGLLLGAEIPGASAQVSLRYSFTQHLRLRSEAWLPLGGWRVAGEGGSARAWLAGPALSLLVGPRQSRFIAPALGAGAAALALHVQGEASSGFRASSSTHLVLVPYARAEVSLRLSTRLSATGSLLAGMFTPRPVLLFVGEQKNVMNPMLSAGLHLEFGLD